jgi:fructose/tagatose bisphosphate aldolase
MLKPAAELIAGARQGRYALGYFESWDMASLAGVTDAAEKVRAPIIVGFNGEFLSHERRVVPEQLEWYAAVGRAAAESASVPCGLIFNECARDDWIRRAVDLGFNIVAVADPQAPPEQYVKRVAALAKHAHSRGVAVEAETEASGVDLLAVSVGNVHIMVRGEQGLDLARLEELHKSVQAGLVLHGGTGISADALKEAVKLGVVKVNYGTYLKQRYLAAVSAAMDNREANPHELLGMGGRADALVAGRLAVRDAVLERIDFLGCCGKA